MLSKKQYDMVLTAARVTLSNHPEWRWGQAVFNVMYDIFPSVANQIRGKSIDMFYKDENVEKFKELMIK